MDKTNTEKSAMEKTNTEKLANFEIKKVVNNEKLAIFDIRRKGRMKEHCKFRHMKKKRTDREKLVGSV